MQLLAHAALLRQEHWPPEKGAKVNFRALAFWVIQNYKMYLFFG
jgi:hypothetical protein